MTTFGPLSYVPADQQTIDQLKADGLLCELATPENTLVPADLAHSARMRAELFAASACQPTCDGLPARAGR